MEDLVTVIITTYKRTDVLIKSIDSVLNQTYKNLELIVVDDNYEKQYIDFVSNIIKSYNDKRIILVKNKKNLGGALSRNEGIKKSRGKYIAFLDDDDIYMPDKIEKQYKLFKKNSDSDLALVYCYCKAIKNGETNNIYKYDYYGNCLFNAMNDCIAATSQWMCKKSALIDVGGFTNSPCKQDSIVMVKLLSKGYTIDRVPEILSLYNEDDNVLRISTNSSKKRVDGELKLLDLCRKNYDKISLNEQNEVEYSFALRLVVHYYILKSYVDFKKCLLIIIKNHPFSIKSIRIYCSILKKCFSFKK